MKDAKGTLRDLVSVLLVLGALGAASYAAYRAFDYYQNRDWVRIVDGPDDPPPAKR